jgi:hypothetical protein
VFIGTCATVGSLAFLLFLVLAYDFTYVWSIWKAELNAAHLGVKNVCCHLQLELAEVVLRVHHHLKLLFYELLEH